MRIGSVSGIAGRGDSGLIRPVPDAETLPSLYGKKKLKPLSGVCQGAIFLQFLFIVH